jgi:N-methylhydantoinase A
MGRSDPLRVAAEHHADYPYEVREVTFGKEAVPSRVVRRDDLRPGAVLEGPAVVVEQTATTVMPPGTRLVVDELGVLTIRVTKEG